MRVSKIKFLGELFIQAQFILIKLLQYGVSLMLEKIHMSASILHILQCFIVDD